jgi:hypothetical protein
LLVSACSRIALKQVTYQEVWKVMVLLHLQIEEIIPCIYIALTVTVAKYMGHQSGGVIEQKLYFEL